MFRHGARAHRGSPRPAQRSIFASRDRSRHPRWGLNRRAAIVGRLLLLLAESDNDVLVVSMSPRRHGCAGAPAFACCRAVDGLVRHIALRMPRVRESRERRTTRATARRTGPGDDVPSGEAASVGEARRTSLLAVHFGVNPGPASIPAPGHGRRRDRCDRRVHQPRSRRRCSREHRVAAGGGVTLAPVTPAAEIVDRSSSRKRGASTTLHSGTTVRPLRALSERSPSLRYVTALRHAGSAKEPTESGRSDQGSASDWPETTRSPSSRREADVLSGVPRIDPDTRAWHPRRSVQSAEGSSVRGSRAEAAGHGQRSGNRCSSFDGATARPRTGGDASSRVFRVSCG